MKRTIKIVSFVVLLFIVLGAVAWVMRPLQYKATAMLKIAYNKPHYVYEDKISADNYEKFVATQKALIRSPIILEKALENPETARLPELLKQKDPVDWLTKHLEVEMTGHSEIMTVSFRSSDPRAAQLIVDSVVMAYLDFNNNEQYTLNMRLINQLNLELARKQQEAQLLQQEIRSKKKTAEKDKIDGVNATNAEVDKIDISFGEDQLRRVNNVIDLLNDRLVQLKTEQNAPNRVSLMHRATLPTQRERTVCGFF